MSQRPLHFNAFIWPNGYHESAWRVVDDDVHDVLGLPYYANIARIAERGLMDSIFLADNIAIAEYRATHLPQTQFDPIFSLNHTCAMLRANICRLIRKTWCTTKKRERLVDHIAIYTYLHNRSLKAA